MPAMIILSLITQSLRNCTNSKVTRISSIIGRPGKMKMNREELVERKRGSKIFRRSKQSILGSGLGSTGSLLNGRYYYIIQSKMGRRAKYYASESCIMELWHSLYSHAETIQLQAYLFNLLNVLHSHRFAQRFLIKLIEFKFQDNWIIYNNCGRHVFVLVVSKSCKLTIDL